MKNKALYGLFSGVSLVVATLIGVALLMPSAESASSRADATVIACAHARIGQDLGYGVDPPAKCLAQ